MFATLDSQTESITETSACTNIRISQISVSSGLTGMVAKQQVGRSEIRGSITWRWWWVSSSFPVVKRSGRAANSSLQPNVKGKFLSYDCITILA